MKFRVYRKPLSYRQKRSFATDDEKSPVMGLSAVQQPWVS
jgi:hypothetical protein